MESDMPVIEKIELRHGNYYQLIQQSSNKALMMRAQQSNEYRDKVPVMDEPKDSELNQVWMIEQIKQRNSHEIVHALSTLVLQNFVRNIKLTFGEWKPGQLFKVEQVQGSAPNAFVIRDKAGSRNFFYADRDGLLQFGERDESAKQIIWLLRIAEKTRAITQSVLFENAFTNMAMDVPEASSKQGVKIVQYPVNKRFNQRFRLNFNSESNTYSIQNVKSLKVLDIKQGSKKQGASIIQWTNYNSPNQRWYIENQGKDLYLIRSAMDTDLCIGIKNNQIKECAQLGTTKSEDFALWRILGEFDKQLYELV